MKPPASAQPMPTSDATTSQSAARPIEEPAEGQGLEPDTGLSAPQCTAAPEIQPPSREEKRQPQRSGTLVTLHPQPDPKSKTHEQEAPRPKYTNQIPDFLLDLDNYTDAKEKKSQRVWKVIAHLPQPPSVPTFLRKSILNDTMPHENDTSVLNMPSHTILNHLATRSIKNDILITSGTTRYKQKVTKFSS
jgi:hypothetical protein